jgi:Zn finger protein HypA/HybF involved in hydrogenase expression
MAAEAYCTKCRTKREIKDAKEVTTANGRHALQGVCPVCGTKLTRFVAGPAKAAIKS